MNEGERYTGVRRIKLALLPHGGRHGGVCGRNTLDEFPFVEPTKRNGNLVGLAVLRPVSWTRSQTIAHPSFRKEGIGG